MNDATQLGILLGAAEAGIKPEALPYCGGVARKFASADGAALGRRVLDVGLKTLQVTGRGNSAPAQHLNLLIKSADCSPHFHDVVRHVVTTLRMLEPMKKLAFADAASGVGLAARGIGYGGIGMGAGLGALYWLLSRHANQDSADLESMQQQSDYYQQLGKELEGSMRNKYRYDDVGKSTKRPRR